MEEILHQLIVCLSHYLQDVVHPRWRRISSINSISCTIEIERNHKIIVRCQDIDTFEPQKKYLLLSMITGWLTGILIMVYQNPYIAG